MTQKKSSELPEVKIEDEPELDVRVEGDEVPEVKEPEPVEPPKDDADALRHQIDELKRAQEISQAKAAQAEQWALQQAEALNNMKGYAEQSQYDSIMTAMGAAQIEVDSAKRDIVMAGAAQDYESLANAQERLATAKARMVRLEEGKDSYEARKEQPQQYGDPVANSIDQNTNLYQSERDWLKAHTEILNDKTKTSDLNTAFNESQQKGLRRGSKEYFDHIEIALGYKQPPEPPKPKKRDEEDSMIVAAPPSRESRGPGGGSPKTSVTLTKEEAEVARLSGITPAEYAKQKVLLQEQQRIRPGDFPKG